MRIFTHYCYHYGHFVLLYAPCCGDHIRFINRSIEFKEKTMSKALKSARPVVEAIVVSIALVVVALAVPAAIVYAAV